MRVAIVGAGIIGASCAFHLARRGAEVTVVERSDQPATGSTGKSAGGIRHQFSHPENVRFSLYSSRAYAAFDRELGTDSGYRKVGYLFLLGKGDMGAWTAQWALHRRLGVRSEALTVDDLGDRFPYLKTSGLAGASLGPDDGVLDPHAITVGYLAAARSMGSSILFGHDVHDLSRRGDGWRLAVENDSLEVDAVINTAGAWSRGLAALAGIEVPVDPYRRNVYLTGPVADFPHPTPLIIDLTTGVYVRSEGDRFLFGLSNRDQPPGFDETVDWSWLETVLEMALGRFPFLEAAGLDHRSCWAGLYAISPDHLPVLGEARQAPGFVNACGFSGHGVQHAPATGLAISEEILDGGAHSFDLTDFRLERFLHNRPGIERNIV